MGILSATATMYFRNYSRKADIESQVKSLYSDITQIRSEAMFTRSGRSVKYSANVFSFYSSNNVIAAPKSQRKLKYSISWSGGGQVDFDVRGLVSNVSSACICTLLGNNNANIDSIVIGTVRTQMGKSNGTCDDANITPK